MASLNARLEKAMDMGMVEFEQLVKDVALAERRKTLKCLRAAGIDPDRPLEIGFSDGTTTKLVPRDQLGGKRQKTKKGK